MAVTRKMKYALIAAMIAAVCALCALPGMAFAATNVTVNYTDALGDAQSAVVDLDTLPARTDVFNYMFQKNGVNNVIKADKTVTLDAVIAAALAANGDEGDMDEIWASGKALAFTSGGTAYTKYTMFTYDRLTAPNYFWGATLSTGGVLGAASDAPAVLALQSGAQQMNATDTTTTAATVAASITTTTETSPRLLWGWPDASVPTDQLGGNRYPSNIDSITIS